MSTGFKTREGTKRACKRYLSLKVQKRRDYNVYYRGLLARHWEITPLSQEKQAEFRMMVKERHGVEL